MLPFPSAFDQLSRVLVSHGVPLSPQGLCICDTPDCSGGILKKKISKKNLLLLFFFRPGPAIPRVAGPLTSKKYHPKGLIHFTFLHIISLCLNTSPSFYVSLPKVFIPFLLKKECCRIRGGEE